MTALALLLALVTGVPQSVPSPAVPDHDLSVLATEVVAAGYRHAAEALQESLEKLNTVSGDSHLVEYWRGFAHMRLAEISSQGTGVDVEKHIVAAVEALEAATSESANFGEGFALLAFVNDWQMMFHHDNKGYYAERTARFLARAAQLQPSNPRVALMRGLDLFHTPEMYGGSREGALKKLSASLDLFAAEGETGTADIDPTWGAVDAQLALGDVHLALGDLADARHRYETARGMFPKCVLASRGLAAVARAEELRAGAEIAPQPIPAPIAPIDGGWPCWRGPDRSGSTDDARWSTEGTELWTRDVGLGYSSLAVAGSRLFTKGYDLDTASDIVYALDAATGEELWRYECPAAVWNEMHDGGTLSAPVVDGDQVFVLNREGNVACLNAEDGEVRWRRSILDEESLQNSRWGFAASPLVLGQQLILNVGRVLSLDKRTGERLWRTSHYGDAYATPTPFLAEDLPRLAVFAAEGLVVVDPRSGKHLAQTQWKTQYDQNCASPLLLDGALFVSSGMDRGCALFDYGEGQLKARWSSKVMRNTMSGSVTDGEAIYGFDHRVLACVTAAGEACWTERGVGWGAISRAGDRLLVVTDDGELRIVQATPARYVELAREKVFYDGKGWTAPVLVDGLLYLRSSQGELVCRDHRMQ